MKDDRLDCRRGRSVGRSGLVDVWTYGARDDDGPTKSESSCLKLHL